ncbi:tetraacyldisaccharide 4'-kinase [Solimonas terrae]|uniref:Tetraacyldisaccharide 4'-kinase n=1 Tax=Solimonas terrae TaxID=1396819 RepID=A0A6M2BW01_9GAMM|nr:tetraacyldisaccharide 4'-kinase [Solimonas terrae]NGY06822.1 tetraacyldisaccharide 4'-kinase [Solimonas terrae]
MKHWLERRWYARERPPLALRPLAALYGVITRTRRRRLQAAAPRLPLPVIVVGNISIGGTGKTPFTLWLVEQLRRWGWRPGVVSRGYGGRAPQYPFEVTPDGDVQHCGDEPLLIAQRARCPVFVDPDRVAAARALIAAHDVDIIVSDDGLQHYRLARDLEICLVDGRRGLGNEALLPAGPLREAPSRLAEVDLIVVNGEGWMHDAAVPMHLQAAPLRRLVDGETQALSALQGQRVHALAGIGDPARFFASLRGAGLQIESHAFADHHAYGPDDLAFADDATVIMTEKDAVKCRRFADQRMWALPVTAQLAEADVGRVRECVEALKEERRRRR